MGVVAKSPLRRRASRSALVKLFEPKGGGIGRMFVSRAALLAFIKTNKTCQFASSRVGFVLILLTTLRLGRIHTRLNGLRATNSSLPVVVLFVASVSLPLSCFGSLVPCQSLGLPGASGDVYVFLFCLFSLLFSFSAVEHLARPPASFSLSLSLLCVLALRVSRLTLTRTVWSSR